MFEGVVYRGRKTRSVSRLLNPRGAEMGISDAGLA